MNSEIENLVANYNVSDSARQLVRDTPVVFLVGVAGAGKDTIKQQLLDTGRYHHIVSHVTRPPRENQGVMETEGFPYHFISIEESIAMLKSHEYIEAKFVHGNVYGTSASEIQKSHDDGKIAITDIDVQGVAEYKEMSDNVIAVFILPPSYEEWQRRIKSRYGADNTDNDDLHKRMHTAIGELEEALSKDYYHYVVNENLDEAVEAVDSIARHNDEFTTIDTSFRVWAEKLLADLRAGLATRAQS